MKTVTRIKLGINGVASGLFMAGLFFGLVLRDIPEESVAPVMTTAAIGSMISLGCGVLELLVALDIEKREGRRGRNG